MTARRHDFADAPALLDTLADTVSAGLQAALDARGSATLVVSGGRTPEELFERLSSRPLDWTRVAVTLADERWVPAGDPASNEGMVRRRLLAGPAAAARFVPLYGGEPTPEAGEAACAARLGGLARPFDLVLLGMGEDGHTASLFPGAPNLAAGLAGEAACLATRPPGVMPPRMTLTLPVLLDARRVILLVSGTAKRAVLDRAAEPGPVEEMPVRAVPRQDRTPVDIFWAP